MSASPAASDKRSGKNPAQPKPTVRRPPDRMPDPPAAARQAVRIAGALVASAAGLATLFALATIYAVPALVPILAPAVILLAAFGYFGVGRIDLARLAAERDRVALENRRLAASLESLGGVMRATRPRLKPERVAVFVCHSSRP